MTNDVRIVMQIQANLSLAMTSFSPFAAAPNLKELLPLNNVVEFDSSYSPVPLPSIGDITGGSSFGFETLTAMNMPQTYIVRGSVRPENVEEFFATSRDDQNIIGVFADPIIQPIYVCTAFL